MSIFVLIVCVILFVFSILEAFVFGKKYARWWFGQWSKDYKDYDLKKYRFIRCATLGIVFILAFLMGFCEFKHSEIYLTAALVVIFLHYYIILHHCKRKGEK